MVSQGSAYFAIWWAWRNFTWFASADDTDDVPYRLLTLLQIGGVLMAAGVADGFGRQDFTVVTVGYVLMRVAMVTQWLRMAHDHPAGRRTALRYAAGIATLQLGWIALLALPLSWRGAGFLLLAAGELAVPVWSEWSGQPTAWHPGHIAERYGLFTLSLAAVGAGLQVVAETVDRHGSLAGRAASLTLAVPVALFLVVLGLLHSWVYR